MNILLALSKDEVRQLVSFGIESRFQLHVAEARTAKEAIDYLDHHSEVDIVICEHAGIGDVLLRHLASRGRRQAGAKAIQCILCAAAPPKEDEVLKQVKIIGHAAWVNVIDSVVALLEKPIEAARLAEALPPPPGLDTEFCRIRTALLIRVGPLKSDIYIRLSSEKYLKLFNEGDRFDENDYRRYLVDKKLDYLYLKTDECSEFLIKFKNDLLKLLQSEILCAQANPDVLEAVHETTQELISKLGATAEVQEVVKANIQVTVKAIGKSPKLSKLLSGLMIDPKKYVASHSVLLPQIAGVLAMGMEWKSDTTLYKLTLAAFLHDIPLTNQSLAAVTSLTELNRRKDQFTEKELKDYKQHPMHASELARQFQEIPPDVDVIVAQHHEQPDGSGFPRGIGHQQISPLAAVFIVAHDLVSCLFDQSKPFVLDEFVEAAKKKYTSGNFKKVLKCLADVKL
jgi:HD-GYP domain-containing protein (c-di-GMP phosphodiesterase class II)